jgi:tetratricopeptide (TPR) repeat protein
MGSVATVEGGIQAEILLYDVQRGRLLEERTYDGTNVFEMADEISVQLRDYLKIPDVEGEGYQDLPTSELLTESPSAFRYAMEALMANQVDRDFAEGTRLIEQAVAEDPTFADAQSSLANLYMFTNRAAEMTGPLQAAMDHLYRLPERSKFVIKSNYYFLVRQDTDKAMAALDMWADLFPDDIQAYQARLTIQAVRDDKDGALESLQTILELDPAQRDVLLQIASLHEAKGDFPAAETALREYAEEFPQNHQVLSQLAGLARRQGKLDEARGFYDRALLLAPSDVGLMVGMGTLETASGDFDAALEQYETAMSAAGTPEERAQVYSAMEAHYMARGQVERSIETLEQRLAEAPSYMPSFQVVLAQLTEAAAYAEAGRLGVAWALVDRARTELPPPFDGMAPMGEMEIYVTLEDADGIQATVPGVEAMIATLQYELFRPALVAAQGEAHLLDGDYEQAIQSFEEQRRLSPASTSVPRQLGRCYRGLGDYDQAVSQLEEALAVSPYSARTNYEMALTYEAMGRLEDARTHLDRALEVCRSELSLGSESGGARDQVGWLAGIAGPTSSAWGR